MTSMLSSSIALSQFLNEERQTSSIVGNVNFIEPNDGAGEPVAICYMPYLHPFTTGDGTPSNAMGQYEGLAAIFLAMEHLNTGNGTIVSELSGINQRCPLKFTTKAFDTEMQKRIGVDHIIKLTDRDRIESSGEGELLPCALIGAAYSSISMPTSIISGLRGFPQIGISTSPALDDVSQYPLFGRTTPNDDGTSIPLLSKLTSWNVKYIAILHIDDSYGNAFAEGIRVAAQTEAPDLRVETVDIHVGADDETVAKAIQQLKDTGFTYFFGIIFPEDLVDRVMIEAFNQGIAGDGEHTWLFADAVGSTVTRKEFPVGSPLERAYRGSGLLSAKGGVLGMEAFDKLSLSIQQLRQNKEDLSFLESQLPQDYSDGKYVDHTPITSGESFLQDPGFVSPFLYDAVVSLGLAACGLTSALEENKSFTGEELHDAFVNTTFEGASGSVVLDLETGTRDPRSALFSLTNFVEDEDASVSSGSVKFKGVESGLYKSGDWQTIEQYHFFDGTSNTPADLPYLETNPNYLSTGLKAVGLVLCGTIVALAFGFSLWAYCNSKKHVVRASQPIFLYIISFGCAIMGLSIIPLTIDLGVADQEGANKACMSFPWLIAIGFSLTFSALFTKTYRINQIMKYAARFKRLKLTVADVIKPMVALLMLNVIVLTVWTVIDPLQHNTKVVSVDPFGREVETLGACSSEHGLIFTATLCVINLGSLIVATIQAYQARNISTELQESSYIFIAMALILLASFMGVPIIVIARDNTTAYYFVTAVLVFVVCSSILLLIFVPKVHALREKSKDKSKSKDTTQKISGLHRGIQTGEQRRATSETSNSSGTEDEGLKIYDPRQMQLELEESRQTQIQLEEENRCLRRLLTRSKNGSLNLVVDDDEFS